MTRTTSIFLKRTETVTFVRKLCYRFQILVRKPIKEKELLATQKELFEFLIKFSKSPFWSTFYVGFSRQEKNLTLSPLNSN